MESSAELKMIREIFEGHIATVTDRGGITEIIWRKPDTINYLIIFLLYNRTLFVTGDLGDAVYGGWNQKLTLKWLADLNLDYFASKCMGSEAGRQYESWDMDKAQKWIIEYPNYHLGLSAQELENYKEHKDEMLESVCSKEYWHNWIQSEIADSIFGEPAYEIACNIGDRVDIRSVYQLEGLKMAFKQIQERGDE